MAYKTSEAERNALAIRAAKIGLDESIAHECKSEEQQDVMLKLQKNVGIDKHIYLNLLKKAPNKASRDLEALRQKIDDLIEHATKTGDKDSWDLLRQLDLQREESNANNQRKSVKSYASKKMNSEVFTKSRRELVLAEYMKYFDAYEPTDEFQKVVDSLDLGNTTEYRGRPVTSIGYPKTIKFKTREAQIRFILETEDNLSEEEIAELEQELRTITLNKLP